ncbi:hypothetical protein [Akkermansia sp.]|uniref:hypothetical protein n=1 Tax=Akkermansia sp. TaxID=1872421 RepID=UPI0025C12F8B|nr:hypothetical protein [Akkermansia sp.]MCD8063654.1 hypothetical protein [Akkermansia sp.]
MEKAPLSALELLNDVIICCTGERILASQVAVLTTVARFPGATSGMIANHAKISLPSAGRLLGYLINSGDVTVFRKPITNGQIRRKFYVTPQGVKTVDKLLRHLAWSQRGKFGVVPVQSSPKEIFEL